MWRPPPPGSPLRRPEGRLGAPRTLPAGHAETYPGSMHALAGPRGPRGGPPAAHKASRIGGGACLCSLSPPGQGHPTPPSAEPPSRPAASPARPHTSTPRKPAASSPQTGKQTCSRLQMGVHKPSSPCPPLEHLLSWAAPPADRSVLGTSDQDPQGSSAHLARQAAAGGF